MVSNKLLIIGGPTACGKTALAVELANSFSGRLISADSRQIYKGMDIGTGKDQPENVEIDMIDIIEPDKMFSAAEYGQMATKIIDKTLAERKLPILVGGSGQYIEAVVFPKETFSVKPNMWGRKIAGHLPLPLVQKLYKTLDKNGFDNMNNSDRSNPRRLQRRLEVALAFKPTNKIIKPSWEVMTIVIQPDRDALIKRIDRRVEDRMKMGLLKEIEKLLSLYKWTDPGLNTIGYKEFQNYFKYPDAEVLEECIERWKTDEYRYAKRQITWFKKVKGVRLAAEDKLIVEKAKEVVGKWYNMA